MLLFLLNRKLNGLPLGQWGLVLLGLVGGSIATGLASGSTLRLTQQFLGTEGLIIQLLQLSISAVVGLVVFAIIVSQLG